MAEVEDAGVHNSGCSDFSATARAVSTQSSIVRVESRGHTTLFADQVDRYVFEYGVAKLVGQCHHFAVVVTVSEQNKVVMVCVEWV